MFDENRKLNCLERAVIINKGKTAIEAAAAAAVSMLAEMNVTQSTY